MNHPSTRRIYRATSLVVLAAFMMGCPVIKTYRVERVHMENQKYGTIPAKTTNGERIYIKRDAVSWSPKKKADKSGLVEATYTNFVPTIIGLVALGFIAYAAGCGDPNGQDENHCYLGPGLIGLGLVSVSGIVWVINVARDHPVQSAAGPSTPKALSSSKGSSFGLGFKGTF